MSPRDLTLLLFGALFVTALALAPAFAEDPASAASEDSAYRGELPLGRPSLDEARTTARIARGVTYMRVERGAPSKEDVFTVDVTFEADCAAAEAVAERLQGFCFLSMHHDPLRTLPLPAPTE